MKRLVQAVLVLLVLLLAGTALGANALLNLEPVRTRITDALSRATGHTVRLDGSIHLAWSLTPTITLADASLLNPPGFSRPDLARIRRLEVTLALAPLLSRRVEIPAITLDGADVLLERDEAGHGNWERPPPPPNPAPATPSAPRAPIPVRIATIRLVDSTVALKGNAPLAIDHLALTPEGGPFDAALRYAGQPVTLQGTAAPLQSGPFPITLTATTGLATLTLTNATPAGARIEATIPALATLSPFAHQPLPPFQDLHLLANLTIATACPPANPTSLGQGGSMPPVANATSCPPTITLQNLTWHSKEADLTGDLTLTPGLRPTIQAHLTGPRLDADAIRTILATPVAAPPPVPTPTPAPPPATPAPIPAPKQPTALPFVLLHRADADITLRLDLLQIAGLSLRAVDAHALLKDGLLTLDPAQAISPAGPVQATLRADARPEPPQAALILHAPDLDADGIATAIGAAPGSASGHLALAVDATAAGATPQAMLPTLTGRLAATLTDGEIDNKLLAALLDTLLRGPDLKFDPNGRSRLRCFALKAEAKDGQATVNPLAFDAGRLRLEGEGALDLPAEQMDLHLRPVLRLGGTAGALLGGVSIPVHVSGPIRRPKIEQDRGAIAPGRLGISIGGPANTADICAPALAAARAAMP